MGKDQIGGKGRTARAADFVRKRRGGSVREEKRTSRIGQNRTRYAQRKKRDRNLVINTKVTRACGKSKSPKVDAGSNVRWRLKRGLEEGQKGH